PDGKLLAALKHSGEVGFFEVATGKLLHAHTLAVPGGRTFLAFAPDGQSVAVPWKPGSIARFEIASGKRLGEFRHGKEEDGYGTVAFSPDGKLLAGLTQSRRRIDVWDAVTAKPV